MAEKRVRFKGAGLTGVRAETGERVRFGDGDVFVVVSSVVVSSEDGKEGWLRLVLRDPKVTHLGGPDGKKREACTIRCQVPAASVELR